MPLARIQLLETVQEEQPGITDKEVYTGSGVFINEKAARARAEPVSEDGEIVLNF